MQNYHNHSRFLPVYHYLLSSIVLAVCILSLIHLSCAVQSGAGLLQAAIFTLISAALVIMYFIFRTYPIRAQNRIIRAEENLRHYILTGKTLPPALTMKQIVGLRFASDEEFLPLIERAINENLSRKDIKKAIQHWRGDYERV